MDPTNYNNGTLTYFQTTTKLVREKKIQLNKSITTIMRFGCGFSCQDRGITARYGSIDVCGIWKEKCLLLALQPYAYGIILEPQQSLGPLNSSDFRASVDILSRSL